jgi:hypothetical protein
MTGDGRRGRRLRAVLPIAVCSLPLLVLVAVMLIRWIA